MDSEKKIRYEAALKVVCNAINNPNVDVRRQDRICNIDIIIDGVKKCGIVVRQKDYKIFADTPVMWIEKSKAKKTEMSRGNGSWVCAFYDEIDDCVAELVEFIKQIS